MNVSIVSVHYILLKDISFNCNLIFWQYNHATLIVVGKKTLLKDLWKCLTNSSLHWNCPQFSWKTQQQHFNQNRKKNWIKGQWRYSNNQTTIIKLYLMDIISYYVSLWMFDISIKAWREMGKCVFCTNSMKSIKRLRRNFPMTSRHWMTTKSSHKHTA